MKKTIFIFLLGAMAISASAQKLEKPLIDKISGDTTLSTQEEQLIKKASTKPHHINSSAIKIAGHYSLIFHLLDRLSPVYSIPKGSKADVKFINGDIIELVALTDQMASSHINDFGGYSDINVIYRLTNDDLAKLKANDISFIRISTSAGLFDYDIDNNKSSIVRKQLQLITIK